LGLIVRITEAEAVRDVAALLDRVRTQGVTVEIVNGEEVVTRIAPPGNVETPSAKACKVEQFIELWKRLPRLDPEDAAWPSDATPRVWSRQPAIDERHYRIGAADGRAAGNLACEA
jgi:hypothetical protein